MALGKWFPDTLITNNTSGRHLPVASPYAKPVRLSTGGDRSTAPAPLHSPGALREGVGAAGRGSPRRGAAGPRPFGLANLHPGRFSLLPARRVARGPRGRLAKELRLLAALPRRRSVVRAQLWLHLQQTVGSLVHIGRTPPDLGSAARWTSSRKETVPSLPLAAGWVTPLGDAPPGVSVPPLSLLLLWERHPRFRLKPGKETPSPDRGGETGPSAAGARRAAAPAGIPAGPAA